MQKKLYLSLFILFSICQLGNAQNLVQDYLFSRTNEPYIELTDDTTLGTGFQDDILYMSQTNTSGINCISCSLTGTGFPIGFPFVFDGNTFTRWAFSSNGFIKLGDGTPFTITNSLSGAMSSSESSQVNLISALHGDIMMTAIQGSFRYRTIGAPGSRKLVVEYRAMKHYTPNVTSEEIYNFQIRLHEGTNRISFAFGTFLKDAVNRTYSVGLKGNSLTNSHLRALPTSATTWGESTRGTSASATMAMNINLQPTSGMVYNFVPRQYDNDLSLEEILLPLAGEKSCPMTTTETIKVRVKNAGLLPQSAAQIGFRTATGQIVNQPVTFTPPLAPQQSQDFTLNTTADLSGIFPPQLSAFVYLPTEEEGSRNNDTVSVRFSIGRNLEQSHLSSYDTLVLKGWKPGRGNTTPTPGFSLWKLGTEFGVNSTMLVMPKDTPLVKNEWIFSPSYNIDTLFNYGISFQAAILEGLSGTSALTALGDDTIKLVYSTDCQQTWKTLTVFNNSDIASNNLTNQLKPFQVILPPSVKNLVTFAFKGKNNGNTFSNDYRFLFRNFKFNPIPRFDLSADTVRIPSIVSPSCRYSSQEPLRLKVTNRGFEAIDSTEAGFYLNTNLPVRKKFAFTPPLQPGASTYLVFDGSSGADVSVPEGQLVTAFTSLRKESVSQKGNDTARYSYNLIAPLSIPTPVYETYASLLGARWVRGRGPVVPSGTFSIWGNRATFPGQQTTGMDFSASQGSLEDWFYSASYEGPSIVNFSFKAAVTAIGSISAVTTMNSDTLKVLYSNDCGASWKSIRNFTTTELSSGVVSNQLKEFTYQLYNTQGSILIGFAGFRKPTAPVAGGFTFHVDSISVTSPSFPDFSSIGILPGIEGLVTCPGPGPVSIGVVVRNSGNLPIPSATVGYKVNGVATSKIVNFSGAGLAAGKVDTIRFVGTEAPVYSTAGTYILKGFVKLTGEVAATAFNDSSAASSFSLFPKVAVPYLQTFTSPGYLPVGWISDTLSGKGFKNTLGRGPLGTQALSFRAVSTSPRANLVTRNFGVLDASTNYLSLSYRTQEQTGAFFRLRPSDFIDVYASTDCGGSYTLIGRIDSVNQVVWPGFLTRDFPLEAYINQNITIKLDAKLTSPPFFSVFLDISRFSIGGPTSTHDELLDESTRLIVFPNPTQASAGLSVRSAGFIRSVQAYGVNGQRFPLEVTSEQDGVYHISTQGLSAGMYVLEVQTQIGLKHVRFVISQ